MVVISQLISELIERGRREKIYIAKKPLNSITLKVSRPSRGK